MNKTKFIQFDVQKLEYNNMVSYKLLIKNAHENVLYTKIKLG